MRENEGFPGKNNTEEEVGGEHYDTAIMRTDSKQPKLSGAEKFKEEALNGGKVKGSSLFR